MVVGGRRIRSEKLRKHQYRGRYARSLEGKGVKWDGDHNVKHMWEQVKRTMVGSARLSESWGGRTQRVCGETTR